MNTHVNFETAKLLKEKEFDIPTIYYFDSFGDKGSATNGTNWNQSEELLTSAPTIAEVVMWLYEKHRIWISVYTMDKWLPSGNNKEQLFDYGIKQMKLGLIDIPKKPEEFNSPTETYEAGIGHTLKHLI